MNSFNSQLAKAVKNKKSHLCIGLDINPEGLNRNNASINDLKTHTQRVISATEDLAVAFKPNLGFYERWGSTGFEWLEETMCLFEEDTIVIGDAKRGDIGNTTRIYARGFFDQMNFDAITLSPYMGSDSVLPYFQYVDKWVVLLALTSNDGASDFQFLKTENGQLFEEVLKVSKEWGTVDNTMFVVGATKAALMKKVRKIVPDNFLLVPGVGAQGGSLAEVAKNGLNDKCGLLVNSSRGIIYASQGEDFAEAARAQALTMQQQMEVILDEAGL